MNEQYLAVKLSDLELMSGAKDPSSGRSEVECLLRSWLDCREIEAHYLELPQPAQQGPGEPVALPARKNAPPLSGDLRSYGWNEYHDEIAKLGPLYSRPVAGRAPECFCVELGLTIEELQAHLAEARALLREFVDCPWVVEEATIPKAGIEAAPQQVVGTMHVGLVRLRKVRAWLSASAEPSRPCLVECDACPRSGGLCRSLHESPSQRRAERAER